MCVRLIIRQSRPLILAPLALAIASCGGATAPSSTATSAPPAASIAASKPAAASPAASTAASASAKPAASAAASAAASGAASAKPAASGSSAAAPKPAGTVYSFDAQDYSYAGPASIEGGLVTLQLRNLGKEVHHMQLLKLNDNATMAQVTAAFSSANPESVFQFVSAVGGPGAIDPNGNTQVTENLAPGQYLLACFIPSPSDGIPHAAKGMVKQLTVTAPASAQPSPSVAAGATVTLKDFTFDGPTTVNAGPVTFKVDNTGPQIHELSVIKLAAGKQLQDALNFLAAASPQPPASVAATGSVSASGAAGSVSVSSASAKPAVGGPPPFEDVGGINGLSQGVSGWTTLTFTPGDYAFICNVPDPSSGKPHWALGMAKAFSVK
jgi:uncharacterized cupredoxin-like copper-binding protein